MRASELLASQVYDASGRPLGPVRDIRVSRSGFRVVGLVVGGGPFASVAHGWGYAQGRADGPRVLRALTRRATRQARFIPAERVADWGPGKLEIEGAAEDLPRLVEELKR
jgi:sporulation protein YlmC with PRC-barrel domain